MASTGVSGMECVAKREREKKEREVDEEAASQRMPKFGPRRRRRPGEQVLSGSRLAPGLGVPFEGVPAERQGALSQI